MKAGDWIEFGNSALCWRVKAFGFSSHFKENFLLLQFSGKFFFQRLKPKSDCHRITRQSTRNLLYWWHTAWYDIVTSHTITEKSQTTQPLWNCKTTKTQQAKNIICLEDTCWTAWKSGIFHFKMKYKNQNQPPPPSMGYLALNFCSNLLASEIDS